EATGDQKTLHDLLPVLRDIVTQHVRGTRFGIHVDQRDGLLVQGEEGLQLTWMDAKVGDWVVTPRRGKAVEINALWYNALCLPAGGAGGARPAGRGAGGRRPRAGRARPARGRGPRVRVVQPPLLVRGRRTPLRRGGR